MAQLFPRSFNNLSHASIYVALVLAAISIWLAVELAKSDYVTGVGTPLEQPVQFSHKHHVSDDGIDCRYCHSTVEKTDFAGIPSTETCMTCHSDLWQTSPILEPVRTSYQTNTSIQWQRVYRLPDFVFFNHSIHINKGIGCSTCHGRVDQMPLVYQFTALRMDWCLDCHRAPQTSIRPRSEIFNMEWTPGADQTRRGNELMRDYGIAPADRLTDCYTCHR
ncbi:MAG: cytochrome c3 family protein [Acidobacteria bacterium]|nr:cytochrome c3 family protein [Acidobacteriota bacterium]